MMWWWWWWWCQNCPCVRVDTKQLSARCKCKFGALHTRIPKLTKQILHNVWTKITKTMKIWKTPRIFEASRKVGPHAAL